MDDKPLLGLCMIVKDEAIGIVDTLHSIELFVDHWTIIDSGSIDGTQELIKQKLVGKPGTLYEEPFVDFATTRNRALELHGDQTQFVIMLSGDDHVTNGRSIGHGLRVEGLRSFLAKAQGPAFNIERKLGTTRFQQTVVVRTDAGWRYRGRTHEVLVGPAGQAATELIPSVSIETQRTGDKTARWRADLKLLIEDVKADPTNTRATFYLAQTQECLGDFAAALVNYRARIKLGGWRPEVYEAMFRLARVMDRLDLDWRRIQQAYLDAYTFDPSRAEPLYAIAKHYYDDRNYAACYLFASTASVLPRPSTQLFVDDEIYSWQALDLTSIAAYHLARYHGRVELFGPGQRAAHAALAARPDDPRLRQNVAFYTQSAIV